jgi:hypothetical protein
VALGKELLPLVVVLEGHALVAVSRTTERRKASSSERQRAEGDWTYEGLLTDSAKLRQMVDQRRYVLVECTGFAISDTALSEMLPEGRGRVGGRLSWEEAVRAGREQLTQVNRPLRFAVDVAVLQDYSHFKPLDPLGDGLASLQQDLRLLMDITALTSPRRQRRPLTEVAIDARIKDLVDRVISTTQDLPDTKMRVRWKATSEAAAAMSALTSEAHTAYREAVDASSSSGDFRELFDRAPSQRVIVLGSAGAGKSFLAQAIARSLATAGKGRLPNRVPVQVSAAKWDPTRSLRDEIAQQAAPGGAEIVLHLVLGVGFLLTAFAVFDFGPTRWLPWVGCLSIGALGVTFLLQGISQLLHNDWLTYLAFQILWQQVEAWSGDVFLCGVALRCC